MDKISYAAMVYDDRESRNKFIGERFFSDKKGINLLNVGGGGKKHLAQFLPNDIGYTEIDIAGQPDIILDLEKDLPFSFEDNSFEAVVCSDVLEHVENPHQVLKELSRVSSKRVIVSLPNCWAHLKFELFSKSGRSGKFYGLPSVKPDDRHKWFFNVTEAEQFFGDQLSELRVDVKEILYIGYLSSSFAGRLLRLLVRACLGEQVCKNLFVSTVWFHLEKRHEDELSNS